MLRARVRALRSPHLALADPLFHDLPRHDGLRSNRQTGHPHIPASPGIRLQRLHHLRYRLPVGRSPASRVRGGLLAHCGSLELRLERLTINGLCGDSTARRLTRDLPRPTAHPVVTLPRSDLVSDHVRRLRRVLLLRRPAVRPGGGGAARRRRCPDGWTTVTRQGRRRSTTTTCGRCAASACARRRCR